MITELILNVFISIFFCGTVFVLGYILGISKFKKTSGMIINFSEEDNMKIAYHEAGHAIVARLSKEPIKIRRIIIGKKAKDLLDCETAGITEIIEPAFEEKSHIKTLIAICIAGYTTEKLVFGKVFNDCDEDLRLARECAEEMVLRYGMSELGGVSFEKKNGEIDYGLFGDEIGQNAKRIIYDELKEAEISSRTILKKHRELLDNVAKELLRKKEMSGEQLEKMIKEYKKK